MSLSPSVQHRMHSEPLWKTTEPSDIEKARRRRWYIRLPAEQCSTAACSLSKNVCVWHRLGFQGALFPQLLYNVPTIAARFSGAKFPLFPRHTKLSGFGWRSWFLCPLQSRLSNALLFNSEFKLLYFLEGNVVCSRASQTSQKPTNHSNNWFFFSVYSFN